MYNLHVFQCDIPKPIHTFAKECSSEWLPNNNIFERCFSVLIPSTTIGTIRITPFFF
nr:MAG TPA: hypothetical protein [Caudoviricetes sp.]